MLKSKTIQLRLVREEDAEFITSLRSNKKYNFHLSKSSNDVDKQRIWIKEYKIQEQKKKQFYFIIEKIDGVKCGTVRLYDFKSDSFCWGSWILNHNKTHSAAIESALLVYKFGFEQLGFKKSHFDVRKENKTVNNFHIKFGARCTGHTSQDYLYSISKEDVRIMFKKYEKFL